MGAAAMNRLVATLIAVGCIAGASRANADPLEKLAGGQEPTLTADEEQVLSALATNRPTGGKPSSQPVIGRDGTVQYLFGSKDPSLVCAPFRICDIELQAGEEMQYANVADKEGWSVETTYAGVAPATTPHLFVSPHDIGLITSLVVTTDRRTYHFRLTSHSEKFMPKVRFVYPDDLSNQIVLLRAQRKRAQAQRDEAITRDTIPETGEYLPHLALDYKIEGRAPWKPVRAYNDGRKTIIQMPMSMLHTEAPSLLVLRSEGGPFTEDEYVMVNYRIERPKTGSPRYLVDSVFDRAIMIAGVGSNQQRVTITRLAHPE